MAGIDALHEVVSRLRVVIESFHSLNAADERSFCKTRLVNQSWLKPCRGRPFGLYGQWNRKVKTEI